MVSVTSPAHTVGCSDFATLACGWCRSVSPSGGTVDFDTMRNLDVPTCRTVEPRFPAILQSSYSSPCLIQTRTDHHLTETGGACAPTFLCECLQASVEMRSILLLRLRRMPRSVKCRYVQVFVCVRLCLCPRDSACVRCSLLRLVKVKCGLWEKSSRVAGQARL